MTLTVAVPGADPVTTLDNGIKIIRLAEYVGAARGTLSTVADSLSVAGTVVKDEQALAVPTTFANNFSSVADSVTIPVADLNYPAQASYSGFLGLRSEGSTPVGGKALERWNLYFNNAGPTVMLGEDGVVTIANTRVPKSIYEHYTLLDLGGFGPTFNAGVTDLNIRAWGITNVSDPISWYLDVLYLIPNQLANSDESNRQAYGAWTFYPPDNESPASDSVPNDIGQYSVLYQTVDGVFSDGEGLDIQTSNAENTEFDWHDIFFNEPEREVSWITFVGTGSRCIKPHTISILDFSTIVGTHVAGMELPDGFILLGDRSGTQGWELSGGAWRILSSSSTHNTINVQRPWSIGQYTQRTPFSAPDPSTYAPQMGPLESFILTIKCTINSAPTGASMSFVAGGVEWSTSTSAIMRRLAGVEIKNNTDGSNQARLCYSDGSNLNGLPGDMSGAGFTSVLSGIGAGSSYWLKIERRFYHWRVKVWADGDAEPSSWTLEAYQPLENGFGGSLVQYPWQTGFSGFPATTSLPITLDNDPNFTPMSVGGQFWEYAGFNKLNTDLFEVNEYDVVYDPDPEPGGSGSYTGAYFHIEKYDGSEDWGTAYVPPGALQVLYTDYAPHHFDGNTGEGTDTHGGNFMAWKETGGKLLQGAAYSQFFFRRPARQPLWGDIKFP